jgi:hypothetical protein
LIYLVTYRHYYDNKSFPDTVPVRGAPPARAHDGQIPRRAIGARNARVRLRATGNDHLICPSRKDHSL